MSGFVAVIDPGADGAFDALIEGLTTTLAFRGPDGRGVHVARPAGLGATLLRADPERTCGPERIGDHLWLAGDVRIDGRAELRRALGAAGETVMPNANDARLVLHAYRAWGEACAAHLIGDFAFAIWDTERALLLCARDALGVKPLFHTMAAGAFVCSNTLCTVLAHPAVSRAPHVPALVDFLRTGFNEDPGTTSITGVLRLPPAHTLTLRVGDVAPRIVRHWRFADLAGVAPAPRDDLVSRFGALLADAVTDRVRGDRAGILLSGGIDSTSIAAVLRRDRPAVRVHAWTNVYARLPLDREGEWAALAASALGIPHTIRPTDDEPLLGQFDDAAFDTPEPMDAPTVIGYRAQMREAAAWSPVLLYGEDGDTLLGAPSLAEMWRTESRVALAGRMLGFLFAHGRLPYLGTGVRRRLSGRAAAIASSAPAPDWLREEALHAAAAARAGAELADGREGGRTALERFLTAPMWQWFFESIDPGQTRAAVDVRLPLTDLRLVRFAATLPGVPWRQQKRILRDAVRGLLPDAIVNRPKTPLLGAYEASVARWRRMPRASAPLHPLLRELVDERRLSAALTHGAPLAVMGAWRALQLDDWLRRSEIRGAAATIPRTG